MAKKENKEKKEKKENKENKENKREQERTRENKREQERTVGIIIIGEFCVAILIKELYILNICCHSQRYTECSTYLGF